VLRNQVLCGQWEQLATFWTGKMILPKCITAMGTTVTVILDAIAVVTGIAVENIAIVIHTGAITATDIMAIIATIILVHDFI
jgi:hypothetical protein